MFISIVERLHLIKVNKNNFYTVSGAQSRNTHFKD